MSLSNVLPLNPEKKSANTEKKRPGLKPGQKIRSAKKLTPFQIQAIALDIRSRLLDRPIQAVTYQSLADKYKSTTVTLRHKPAIREAMDALNAAIDAANRLSAANSDEEEMTVSEKIRKLESEIREQDATIKNYERQYQALALWFLSRGQSLAQVKEEALQGLNEHFPATSEPNKSLVRPIFRR
jgi:hypothetical protein